MWRRCDLHNHSTPNEQDPSAWDASAFCESAVSAGMEVIALTDHDHFDHVEDAQRAAERYDLDVIAGIELSTDQGHVIAIAPDQGGLGAIADFARRVGAVPGQQISFDGVIGAYKAPRSSQQTFADSIVLIGAHVDQDRSLLATSSSFSLDAQLDSARKLHALEVSAPDVLSEWQAAGVKQSQHRFALIQGSDTHDSRSRRAIGTWIYLPEISMRCLRHAFAMPEASISTDLVRPSDHEYSVDFLEFSGGGHHDGERFEFSPRTNAIIGPPNAGKSLLIDAFKFVFGVACDLPEVESITAARMSQRLPRGTTVRVGVTTPDGHRTYERTVGGAIQPEMPFRPIIFSQTELTRRSIAASPAIQLLDLHCENIDQAKESIATIAEEVETRFLITCARAAKAHELWKVVSNPADGLVASRSELNDVAGHESVASLALELEKVKGWQERTVASIEEWLPGGISEPDIPAPPPVEDADGSLAPLMPIATLQEVVAKGRQNLDTAITELRKNLLAQLATSGRALKVRLDESDAELDSQGFGGGSELLERVRALQAQVLELESKQQELTALEAGIDADLVELRRLSSKAQQARAELSEQRKQGCRRVNESMHSFFARIDPGGETSRLQDIFDDLKTGTNLRPATQQVAIQNLDRMRVLECAIRLMQGKPLEEDPATDTQDKVIAEAVEREKLRGIAELACCFPGDALDLGWKEGKPPTPFAGLTEGLRALAIKEISFAASKLPVISDQPEDAVPTRSVFASLVPTLREQRAGRQFIVVSHDANIVVTSDAERIFVLSGDTNVKHSSGGLFDADIQAAALEHLEGGRQAFLLRSDRYGPV